MLGLRSLLIGLAALLAAGCTSEDPLVLDSAQTIEPRWPIEAFELSRHDSRPFTRDDLMGRWSLVFSGFTHCPDICPATLAVLKAAESGLDESRRPQVMFVTVDPDRDTPARLAEYLGWFNEDWIGLHGDRAALRPLLDSLQMAYVRVPTGDGEYTMDHATAVVLIDPSARVAAYWPAPHDARAIGQDLARLPRP